MSVVVSLAVVQICQPQHGQEHNLKVAGLHESFEAEYVGGVSTGVKTTEMIT